MERITYQEIPQGMFEKLRAIEDFLKASTIDHHLAELVKLRVSQLNGCAYCVDMHHKELKHLGEDELRLSSLCVWEDTSYFSDVERVVLKFAEEVTLLTAKPIASEVYDALSPYFNKEEISFLTLVVTQINTWNRLMKVFQFVPGRYQVAVGA
ncbi:MAG TPA: carboxymuconolactone decarboxylase [Microscillaceae bacterium]|nr:carboxymuconolactone decarboxylase [Microscillaceae bacterium]